MKNLFTCIFSMGVLLSCVSSKTEKEFNSKRPDVVLVISQASQVEKKAAVNVLLPEYINTAPADTTLLSIFNSYLLYYLDNLGYKKLVIKNETFRADVFAQEKMAYNVQLAALPFKEYKHKEDVSNGTDSKTVKMRGIEFNPSASVSAGLTPASENKDLFTAKANAYKDESQEGEFKKTYGVKDMVQGNKSGSTKYVYNVQHLQDGVFENLCVEAAARLANEIDYAVKKIYQKQLKEKK